MLKHTTQLERLWRDGFDDSERRGQYVHVSCSQCEALVINGVACHERGCCNQPVECPECGQTWPDRVSAAACCGDSDQWDEIGSL